MNFKLSSNDTNKNHVWLTILAVCLAYFATLFYL